MQTAAGALAGGRGLLLSIRVFCAGTAALSPDPTPLPQPHPAKEEDSTERTGWQAGGRGGAVLFGGWGGGGALLGRATWSCLRAFNPKRTPAWQKQTRHPRLAKADEKIFGCKGNGE